MENSANSQPEENEGISGLMVVIERTSKENPDSKDIETIISLLDSFPQIYQTVDSISQKVFNTVFHQATKDSAFHQECFKRHIKEMKTEFGYDASSLIERLLIDEILISWLRLQIVEKQHYAILMNEHAIVDGMYWDKRLNAAQKRFLRSSETLVKLRKMIIKTRAKGVKMIKDLKEKN